MIEEIAALDLQGAASPMEVEGELPDMNAREMAKEGFYLVKSVLRHRYRQGRRGHLGALLCVCSTSGTPKLSSGRLLVPEQPW